MQVQNYREQTVATFRERARDTSQLIQSLPGGQRLDAEQQDLIELSALLRSYPAEKPISELETELDNVVGAAEGKARWFKLGGSAVAVAGLAAGGFAAYSYLQGSSLSPALIGTATGGVAGLATSLVLFSKGRGHTQSVATEKKMQQSLATWGGWMSNPQAQTSMAGLTGMLDTEPAPIPAPEPAPAPEPVPEEPAPAPQEPPTGA